MPPAIRETPTTCVFMVWLRNMRATIAAGFHFLAIVHADAARAPIMR